VIIAKNPHYDKQQDANNKKSQNNDKITGQI
jgi:hypothetical protein